MKETTLIQIFLSSSTAHNFFSIDLKSKHNDIYNKIEMEVLNRISSNEEVMSTIHNMLYPKTSG